MSTNGSWRINESMPKPRKRTRPKRKDRECGTKQRFQTLDAAEAAAKRPWKALAAVGFMKAYQCRVCGAYHYGHQ